MNIEFHYYVVYFLSLRAGFSDRDAQIVAHSSQFVDHNIISYRVQSDHEEYQIEPTQNYGFWSESFPREVYIPFHFFPGDTNDPRATRIDGGSNRFNTTPNSDRVKQLLVAALKTRNLYRVGIALHTYADSWAHQNFSGRREPWNTIEANTPIPSIGHAQVLAKPDNYSLSWEDPRLSGDNRVVNNRARFMSAARQIYKYLRTYNKLGYEDLELVEWELSEILGHPGTKPTTTERINDFIIGDSMSPYSRDHWLRESLDLPGYETEELMFRGYSKVLWLRDAVLYRSRLVEKRPVAGKGRFFESHLYRWHEAAKEHRLTAQSLTSDLEI